MATSLAISAAASIDAESATKIVEAIYQGVLLVSADHKGAGKLAGLDRATGKIVWSVNRPKLPNYASPIILNINGKDQALFTGTNLVTSLDPLTGKTLAEVAKMVVATVYLMAR